MTNQIVITSLIKGLQICKLNDAIYLKQSQRCKYNEIVMPDWIE